MLMEQQQLAAFVQESIKNEIKQDDNSPPKQNQQSVQQPIVHEIRQTNQKEEEFRESAFAQEASQITVQSKRGGRKKLDMRHQNSNNFTFSLRPEEQKEMIKSEDGVMTQNKQIEMTESNPFFQDQDQSVLLTGNESSTFIQRTRGRKRGSKIVTDTDLSDVLVRNQNIALDADKPKEEQLVYFASELIQRANELNGKLETFAISFHNRIETIVAKTQRVINDLERKMTLAAEKMESYKFDKNFEMIKREVEGFVIKQFPCIKEQFCVLDQLEMNLKKWEEDFNHIKLIKAPIQYPRVKTESRESGSQLSVSQNTNCSQIVKTEQGQYVMSKQEDQKQIPVTVEPRNLNFVINPQPLSFPGCFSKSYTELIQTNDCLLGLYSAQQDQTDLVQLEIDSLSGIIEAKFLRSIPRKLIIAVLHDGRLLCDNEVYLDGELVQTLKVDPEEITCALVIDAFNVLIGTNKYGGMCHFKWLGPKYMYKSKPRKIIKHYAPKCRQFEIRQLQLLDEKIYCASRNHLYKFNKSLDYDKMGDTYRLRNDQIYVARQRVEDYHLTKDKINIVALLTDNTILVVDQFTSFLVAQLPPEYFFPNPRLYLAPNFDLVHFPAILKQKSETTMDLVDIMKSGCFSDQLGNFEFKILGPIYMTSAAMSSDISRLCLIGINPVTQRLQVLTIEGLKDQEIQKKEDKWMMDDQFY